MLDKLVSLSFLVISIGYTYTASSLSFGTIAAPKAGFLPVIAGTLAILLALAIVTKLLLQNHIERAANLNWKKFIFIAMGLVFYVILFKLVGYEAATFAIMFYFLKVTETAGWIKPCLLSTGVTISFYFIFAKLLGSNLP